MEPLISSFVGDLNAVLDKYRDQGMTNADAIGGLEIVKLTAWKDAMDILSDSWGENDET